MSLIEIAPNCWVVEKRRIDPPRSNLSAPMLITDEMPPTEQVDGRHYTSKALFRAVGRAHGLTEVGNEKPTRKQRASNSRVAQENRRQALKVAQEKYRAGYRTRSG